MRGRLATLAASVAMTLVAGTAWAYWSTDSTAGSNGAAAATTVNQGATPTASASGQSVTVSWAATTLANGQPVDGYLIKRFDSVTLAEQTIGSACAGVVATTSCVETNVPVGTWRYSVTPVIGANWQGAESTRSSPVVVVAVDVTPPTNSLSLSSVTGGAFLSGTTVHYRGAAAGGFSLTNAVADAGSGPASSQTAALTGTTTGWSHTPSTVSTPAGGPYVSNPFAWTAGTTGNPGEAVTGRDVAGNTAVTNLTFSNDSAAPTAGTITYADGFASGRSVSISFTTGTDSGSGIANRRLQRAIATLNGSSCGTFSGFTDIGADSPASPYVDGSLAYGCYKYRYVVTDRVGNQDIATSTSVVKVSYAGAVEATPGLLSHWRLGEADTALTASDSFTGTSGSTLAGRSPDQGGGTWAHQAGTAEAVIDTGRIRRNLTTGEVSGYTIDYLTTAPSSADYSVEADLVVRSNLAGDMVGVIGRHNSATNTFYMARWEQADTSWNLVKYTNGSVSWLNYVFNQPALTVNEAYRIRLEMTGSTLNLYVNGVLKVSATDSTISAAGRAGIMDGENALSGAKTATTGIHLDNFQVTPSTYPRAADSKGSNTGDYENGVTLGVPGALATGTNTAVTFDGVNDHVQMTNTTGFPTGAGLRSTELWFKTTSSARQVLFRYGSGVDMQEYGLWIDAGGTTMTAWGFGWGHDKTFTMPSAVNNGAWHHVVKTYDGTSLRIYIDGVALPAQTASRATVMDMYGFGIGAVIRPSDGNSGGFFQGSIDEVSFYTQALTQAQVTDHYQLGGAPSVDGSGPTGGSIDATGLTGTGSRYSTSTTLSLAFTNGTDPSGVATSGHQVRRATATLTNGACGSYGSSTLVTGGNDPTSPLADAVADQACYRYEYVVQDTLGNATTYTSPDIKVDTTAPPAPSLTFATFTNTYWSGTGSTVYYRSAATSGSVIATASATDSASGIASYTFPGLGTGWTSTPGALGANTYSWSSASPAAPGTKNVSAANNAGLSSANAPFTMTADDTAPTAGSVSYANGTQTSTSVSVSFVTGTDSGSGIGTRLLQRAAAPLTGTSCGTYGSFTTVAGGSNPTSPFTDTVPSGNCYLYQYIVSDNVGNTHTATSANVVKVPVSCSSQLISNGGFENGADPTPWSATPSDVVTSGGSIGARTGSWKALLGGQGTDTTETLSQVVTIPSGCSSVTLTYWLRVTTSETSHPWDYFRVQVGATVLQSYSDSDAGSSYVQRTVDLSAYAGQTITLTFLADEDSSIQTSFWLDDVSLTAGPPQSYLDTISGTTGLLSYYRLGETTTSADSMTGTAGATLQSRNGETGATWTRHGLSGADAVLTDAGRVRKGGTSTWHAVYHSSGVPATADYTVEADVYVASNLANDMIGVVGRMSTTADVETYYLARYEQGAQTWTLYRRLNGSWDWLGTSAQTLTPGTTYRLALDMTGTSIRLLVDGVQRVAVTDSAISAAGRGGVALGLGGAATTVSNTTGMHLDNFRVSPPLADSKGTNHGDYLGGVTLGTTGAIAGDADTAATFDGTNDHGSVTRQIADNFTVELWFKAADGVGLNNQWWGNAGLVDAEVGGSANDFGISLRSDGRVVAGVGPNDTSVVSTNGGYDNNSWHHVVFTRTQSSGALALYIDGVAAGTATGSTASLTSSSTLTFGRVQGGSWLSGSLDEVAVYNAVLGSATVADHYAAGAP